MEAAVTITMPTQTPTVQRTFWNRLRSVPSWAESDGWDRSDGVSLLRKVKV